MAGLRPSSRHHPRAHQRTRPRANGKILGADPDLAIRVRIARLYQRFPADLADVPTAQLKWVYADMKKEHDEAVAARARAAAARAAAHPQDRNRSSNSDTAAAAIARLEAQRHGDDTRSD